MSKATTHRNRAFQAIHNVLVQEWDPLSVKDCPAAHGEYDSYIPTIYRLITGGADREKLARHLEQLKRGSMGLTSSHGDRDREIARLLHEAVDGI